MIAKAPIIKWYFLFKRQIVQLLGGNSTLIGIQITFNCLYNKDMYEYIIRQIELNKIF